jgi:hypothetical protein
MPCPACNDALTYSEEFESSAKTVADLKQYATACKYCQILLALVNVGKSEDTDSVSISSDRRNRCTKGVRFYAYSNPHRDTTTSLNQDIAICNLLGV